MDNQNSTPAAFPLQPPRNDLGLTIGFIEVTAATELCIQRNGAIWLYEADGEFEIVKAQMEGAYTRVWGSVPFVIEPGSQRDEAIITSVSTNRVIPAGAWAAAVAVIDHDLENGNLKGPEPTPTPPMPPLVDLSEHYLLNVA